jgi:hypothetical protein
MQWLCCSGVRRCRQTDQRKRNHSRWTARQSERCKHSFGTRWAIDAAAVSARRFAGLARFGRDQSQQWPLGIAEFCAEIACPKRASSRAKAELGRLTIANTALRTCAGRCVASKSKCALVCSEFQRQASDLHFAGENFDPRIRPIAENARALRAVLRAHAERAARLRTKLHAGSLDDRRWLATKHGYRAGANPGWLFVAQHL